MLSIIRSIKHTLRLLILFCAVLLMDHAAHAHKIILQPPPPTYTWTIDPGPAVAADKATPHMLWFQDGQWVVFTIWGDDQNSVWAMNTADGTTHLLAKGALAQSVSPDGSRIAVATADGLHVLTIRETPAVSPSKPIPWPVLVPIASLSDSYAHPIVTWLDDQTLISLQRIAPPPDDESYGYTDHCHAITLSSPASPKPFLCPQGEMSHTYDIVPGPNHLALVRSAAEGCDDIRTVKLDPTGTAHNTLALPAFNLWPLGPITATFSNGGDPLLISPCDLDHADPSLTCSRLQETDEPAHLFLWTALAERPKRLYSNLPPDALSDGAARKIAWGVKGGVCVATLDPLSARQCWPTPNLTK